jgi:hypothetical protein
LINDSKLSPSFSIVAPKYSPFSVVIFSSFSSGILFFSAKDNAAFVNLP